MHSNLFIDEMALMKSSQKYKPKNSEFRLVWRTDKWNERSQEAMRFFYSVVFLLKIIHSENPNNWSRENQKLN